MEGAFFKSMYTSTHAYTTFLVYFINLSSQLSAPTGLGERDQRFCLIICSK